MTMITNSSSVPLLSASGTTRICLRIRQEIVNAVIALYNDPNTSSGGSSRVDLQACKLGTGRRFTTS